MNPLEKCKNKFYRARDKENGKKIADELGKKPFQYGLNKETVRKEKIIVSMASYRLRYHTIVPCLKSILYQTVKPDRIMVWLDEECGQNAITEEMEHLREYGVEFYFTADQLKSHKKYFYAMQKFPEDLVITVDDDLVYSEDLVESLLEAHKKFPEVVCARRVHRIRKNADGTLKGYMEWDYEYRKGKKPSYGLCATGGAGTLYPPHSLPPEAFCIENIKRLCMDADDIWLKIMELRNEKKVFWVENKYVMPMEVGGSQENALNASNVWKNKNDEYIAELLKEYPGVMDKILDE